MTLIIPDEKVLEADWTQLQALYLDHMTRCGCKPGARKCQIRDAIVDAISVVVKFERMLGINR